MKKFFSKILLAIGFASALVTSSSAVPVAVDLADATTSIVNVGNAMVLLGVTILGFALVIGFISRRR